MNYRNNNWRIKMTLNEFKCWLDGFSECIIDAPSKMQWEKILTKLDNVESEEMVHEVNEFIEDL